MAKKKKRKLKKKIKKCLFLISFMFLLSSFLIVMFNSNEKNFIKTTIEFTNNFFNKTDNSVNMEKVKEEKFSACMNEKYSDDSVTTELSEKISSLNSYLKKYNASVYYEDTISGFSYIFNDKVDYYAASTIKMLDAVYIYKKAIAGELSLDETVIYERKHIISSSKGVKQHAIGSAITLRNLVKYAILYSDNSAHAMLVQYIGFNNLKNFGKSLGATKTLYGGDNFGITNVYDSMIYVKELDKLIKSNTELGNELKSYFIQSEVNYLKFDNIEAATKYGHYSNYSHNQGIVYDKYPYYIVVLTRATENNFKFTVTDINSKIYEVHQLYYSIKENKCKIEVYGN